MPVNGFSAGRDLVLTIMTATGTLSLSLLSSFKSKQDSREQMIVGIDGVPRPVRFFQGWSGSLDVDRQDATVDEYFSQLEADYFAGVGEGEVTITETITEVDGSVSQFRFRDVLLKLDDAGDYRGDQVVKQALSFIASRRVNLA